MCVCFLFNVEVAESVSTRVSRSRGPAAAAAEGARAGCRMSPGRHGAAPLDYNRSSELLKGTAAGMFASWDAFFADAPRFILYDEICFTETETAR